MVNLLLRTEYNFLKVYGQISKIMAVLQGHGASAAGIADENTFGHIQWAGYRTESFKPLLGVTLIVQPELKNDAETSHRMAFIARNNAGLEELYQFSTKAAEQMYYGPRLNFAQVAAISENVTVFNGGITDLELLRAIQHHLYIDINPSSTLAIKTKLKLAEQLHRPVVATSDNRYPRREDRAVFELLGGRLALTPQYILTEREMRHHLSILPDSAFSVSGQIAAECTVTLPKAENIRAAGNLEQLCRAGIAQRELPWDEVYEARLQHELKMIGEKRFADYFLVISDMVRHAKTTMLVGPARGSAAGSLVCYLLRITEVDPLKHNLLFERFIDVTRADLPDIDLDFPDQQRESVIQYLRDKYGAARIAHIGTIARYQPKSILVDVGKKLKIPAYEMNTVKKSIIERSGGDSRAGFCLLDTFNTLDVGKALLAKYPALSIAAELEEHARHSGVHAAGIIVCNDVVAKYCTISREGVAQIDKQDAEKINLLKIDILGLRILTVLEDALEIGQLNVDLYSLPLDDPATINIIASRKYAGIFQFEGKVLQSIANQLGCESFNDIAALTALARPGPLNSGGTSSFIKRRHGKEPITYDATKKHTEFTYGIVVYQEQVMSIGRDIGQLDWEDISQLRKAMSKSLGKEFFNRYWDKFKIGANKNGIAENKAREIWDTICTHGSWSFNLSHAVSYALLSYWCAWLKAHYPLVFAAACLRNERDDDKAIALLRELVEEGFNYVPFDATHSDLNWTVQDNKLYGGFLGLKGIGTTKAQELITARAAGTLTVKQQELLAAPEVLWADIFPTRSKWGHLYTEPEKHNINGPIHHIRDIEDAPGEYVIIGRLINKNLRDMNETVLVARRNGKILRNNLNALFLQLEDDTSSINAMIGRFQYDRMGKEILETGELGSWWLVRGVLNPGWPLFITKIKRLDEPSQRQQ